ncbi:MAG: MlaD family protein, partial [Deltaproteobacteria bacterium]|nr:MlaD family protein [Deltaproteobacteria bacterium]
VWLGASKYFQKGTLFVTYFDESVQGLSVDSNVKYRGVNAGTVRSIQVAPDQRLVEVVMKIFMEGGDEKNLTAKLKSAGLTGIVYIELDRADEEEAPLSPKIDFRTQYPVIPSRPSDSKYILSMVDNIISELNKMDIKGIFQELRGIVGGMDRYVNGPKIKSIVDNLESTTAHMDHAVQQIDKVIAEGKLGDLLKETKGTIADTRALIGKIRADLDQMKLADTAGQAKQIVAGVDKSVKEITHDLRNTMDNVQRASENLDILMDKLRDDPSDLLFSRPPPVSPRER